jgi:hypothetical protein
MARGNFAFIVIILRTCLVVCKQILVLLTTHALRPLCYRHHRCRLHKPTVSYSRFVTQLGPFSVAVLDACLWTAFYGVVLECFL